MATVGDLANSLVSKPWEYTEVATNRPLIALEITFEQQKLLKNDMGGLDQALVAAKLDKAIPITHLEFGVSRSLSAGNQSSSGSAQFKSLRFAASNDSYTALLTQVCVEGEKFTKAVFSYVAHSGQTTEVVMSVTLEDGFVTDVEVVDGLVYCQLVTRTLKIDNKANKPFSCAFFNK